MEVEKKQKYKTTDDVLATVHGGKAIRTRGI
jgi:hypothetical protein